MKQEDKPKILNVKMDSNIHKKLKIQAAIEGASIKDLVEKIVNEYCDKAQKKL